MKKIIFVFCLTFLSILITHSQEPVEVINNGGNVEFHIYSDGNDSNKIYHSDWINVSAFNKGPLVMFHTNFDASGADSLAFLKIDGLLSSKTTTYKIDTSIITLRTNGATLYHDTLYYPAFQVGDSLWNVQYQTLYATAISDLQNYSHIRVRWGVKDLTSGSPYDGVFQFWITPLGWNPGIPSDYFYKYYKP